MGAVALYLALGIGCADCQPSDLHRFPSKDAVLVAASVYDARMKYLQEEQSWDPRNHWVWQDRIDALERWRNAWRRLGDAIDERGRGGVWTNECLIINLRRLRELIGEDAYAAGQMPMVPP